MYVRRVKWSYCLDHYRENMSNLPYCVVLLLAVAQTWSDPIDDSQLHVRHKRQTVDERAGCQSGATVPVTRVDTTSRLAALRSRFAAVPGGAIHAYIVPNADAHLSEYTAAYDQRRGYISGFTGSAGTAVIIGNKAALWTDGRYFLEAEDTLDCNWILMKLRVSGYPSISEWLKKELENTTNARVGASPFLLSASSWKSYSDAFKDTNVAMVNVNDDLIDQIWTSGRPAQPNTPINELPMKFAGRTWQDKIDDVRSKLVAHKSKAYVVTSLDETAWLFNLRASDVNYNPFFISYAIVETDRIRLYLLNHLTKLTQNPTDSATVQKLYQHLNTGVTGSCGASVGLCVEVLAYSSTAITSDVSAIATSNAENKIWVSYDCNQAIYAAIPEAQRIHDKSAIALMKSKKNAVERQGMEESHIRDAVALIEFMEKLEREVKAGKYWTEVSAALDLKQHRLQQPDNRGLSFASIAGSGSNGAIIHYRPTNATDKQITTTEMFLLDSGGQYLDGTTDVTRTFHFGTPSDYEKECYTRVLMGHLDLALLRWPRGLYGRQIDAITRAALWDVGLIYRHGTGHGIGAYLSVHEGPGYISVNSHQTSREEPLDEYMYFSDEPGYYEDGQFGIRLETIVGIERIDTKYTFDSTVILGFKPVCLVPYEPNLIMFDMLNARQKKWLVDYHKLVLEKVYPRLSEKAKDWVKVRYDQFIMHKDPTSGVGQTVPLITVIACSILSFIRV